MTDVSVASNRFDSSVKTRMFREQGIENRYDQTAKPNHPSFAGGVAFGTGWGLHNSSFSNQLRRPVINKNHVG